MSPSQWIFQAVCIKLANIRFLKHLKKVNVPLQYLDIFALHILGEYTFFIPLMTMLKRSITRPPREHGRLTLNCIFLFLLMT